MNVQDEWKMRLASITFRWHDECSFHVNKARLWYEFLFSHSTISLLTQIRKSDLECRRRCINFVWIDKNDEHKGLVLSPLIPSDEPDHRQGFFAAHLLVEQLAWTSAMPRGKEGVRCCCRCRRRPCKEQFNLLTVLRKFYNQHMDIGILHAFTPATLTSSIAASRRDRAKLNDALAAATAELLCLSLSLARSLSTILCSLSLSLSLSRYKNR